MILKFEYIYSSILEIKLKTICNEYYNEIKNIVI